MEMPKMLAAKMDREELQNAIRRNEYELFTYSGKSECWKTFCKLRHRQTKEEVFGVACCNCCKKCLLYKIRTNEGRVKEYGTKNMKDHARRCNFNLGPVPPALPKPPRAPANTNSTTGGAGRGRKPASSSNLSAVGANAATVSTKDHETIRRSQCMLVASAHLPYSFVDNARFRAYAQKLVTLGARYGNLSVDQVLNGHVGVRSDAVSMMRDVKTVVRQALASSRQQNGVAFATDLWTDHAAQRTYLDVTFFWIDESGADRSCWSLRHAMYACRGVPPSDSGGPPSPRYVEETLNEILHEAGCSSEDTPVTTNCGNYVVAATGQKTRIDCACHRINTVVATAWERCKGMSTIAELDENCRALVRYVRRAAGIQAELETPLKLGGRARPWRALAATLGSVLANVTSSAKLRELLRERGRDHLLDAIDATLLASTVTFLSSLDEVFEVLEYSAIPTLQNVAPGFYLLRNLWEREDPTDPPEVRRMKLEFVTELDRELWMSVTVVHLTATFLDPSLKSFAFVRDPSDRAALVEQARTSVLQFASTTMSSSATTSSNGHNEFQSNGDDKDTPAAKIKKLDPFAEFRTPSKLSQQQQQQQHMIGNRSVGQQQQQGRSASAAAEQDLREELCRYESTEGDLMFDLGAGYGVGPASSSNVFNPLMWWGVNKYKFPILSTVAKIILVIPGSSCESEKVRQAAGAEKLARKSRARIKVDELEPLVLVAEGIKSGVLVCD